MALEFYITFLLATSITVRTQIMQHEAYDYCDPKLKLCEVFSDHTMCKYPVAGLSSQCTPNIHEPLTPNEKKMILFWHNKFRSNVANGTEKNKSRKLPTASNMRQIYWDNELEAIAIRWAEQCISSTNSKVYDKCRNTKRFQVSQNIGTRRVNGTSIDKQAPQIVITWFKESKDFDPALIDKFVPIEGDKVSVEQFANIIWADVYAIGCARIIFQEALPVADKKFKRKTTWTIERLICNYGPGGNEIGKPVYKRGTSCENCPSGTHCSLMFPGLCAIQESEKSENQQNLGNQEAKEESTIESEESTRDLDVALTNLDSNKEQSPSTGKTRLEDQKEGFLGQTLTPNEGEDETVKNRPGDLKTELGQEETSISDYAQHFDDELKRLRKPKPTAGKTIGKKVHSDRNENEILNYSIRKWLVGKKSKRAVNIFHPAHANNSPCQCDDVIFGDSTRAKALNKVHFLFLFVIYLMIL